LEKKIKTKIIKRFCGFLSVMFASKPLPQMRGKKVKGALYFCDMALVTQEAFLVTCLEIFIVLHICCP